jgi:hypothetical protein
MAENCLTLPEFRVLLMERSRSRVLPFLDNYQTSNR